MKATGIIERLRHATGAKSLAELARILDVAPAAVTNAIRAKRIPDVWLYKIAYQFGRRVEWLREGDGPEMQTMIAEAPPSYMKLPAGPRRNLGEQLDRYLTEAPAEEVASIRRLIETLTEAAPDTRQHIVEQLKLLERLTAAEKELEKLTRLKSGGSYGGAPPAGKAAG